MENLFLSERYSQTSEKWNEQRRKILREVLEDHAFPTCKEYFTTKLRERASEYVMQFCSSALEQYIYN